MSATTDIQLDIGHRIWNICLSMQLYEQFLFTFWNTVLQQLRKRAAIYVYSLHILIAFTYTNTHPWMH